MRLLWKLILCAAIVGAMSARGGTARANSLLAHLDSQTLINSGPNHGDYLWTYDLDLTDDSYITGSLPVTSANANYIVLYDFTGYVSGTAHVVSGAFTPSVSNTGPNPGVIVADDPSIPNITFLYTGGRVNGGGGSVATVTLVSTYGLGRLGQTACQDWTTNDTSPDLEGERDSYTRPDPAPEPAGWAMLFFTGMGGGAALLRRRRP